MATDIYDSKINSLRILNKFYNHHILNKNTHDGPLKSESMKVSYVIGSVRQVVRKARHGRTDSICKAGLVMKHRAADHG